MSTNTIIALVVAALVILGGGYYVMSGGYSMSTDETARVGDMDGDGKPDTDVSDTDAPQGKAVTGAFTGSFFDLAARGGNYKCDVESAGTNNDTTGTVYVSGADLRGDFTIVTSGKTIESHMLKKDDMIYVWSSLMPQGVSMKATAMMGQGSAATQGQGVSGTQSYGWNCAATGTDASMFVVPGGIKFTDVSAMMPGASAGASAGTAR